MDERAAIAESFHRAVVAGEPVMLATVVDVEGSTYRRPGARMLVQHDGQRLGAISGGCLERDLAREGWGLSEKGPVLLSYDTRGDAADPSSGYGTGCSGLVHVLVERWPQQDPLGLHQVLLQSLDEDERASLATVYRREGEGEGEDLPQMGERLHFRSGERLGGGLGDELLEDELMALAAVEDGTRPFALRIARGASWCELLVEPLAPRARLLVLGAGDDARPLVRLAASLGQAVTVIDKRPGFATPERFPEAAATLTLPPEAVADEHPLPTGAAVVLMTHSLPDDRILLPAMLRRTSGYVGMLGPKQRAARVLTWLHRDGHLPSDQELARLHAPVGLDLGSAEPGGIALAILAEIEAVRHGRRGAFLANRDAPNHEPARHRSLELQARSQSSPSDARPAQGSSQRRHPAGE